MNFLKPLELGTVTIILFMLSGCTLSTGKITNLTGQKESEQVANQLYASLKNNDYKGTYALYADTFFKVVDTAKLIKFYKKYESSSGNIEKYTLVNFQSKTMPGSVKKTNCVAIYKVERRKGVTNERIILKILGDQSPRIMRYNVDEVR